MDRERPSQQQHSSIVRERERERNKLISKNNKKLKEFYLIVLSYLSILHRFQDFNNNNLLLLCSMLVGCSREALLLLPSYYIFMFIWYFSSSFLFFSSLLALLTCCVISSNCGLVVVQLEDFWMGIFLYFSLFFFFTLSILTIYSTALCLTPSFLLPCNFFFFFSPLFNIKRNIYFHSCNFNAALSSIHFCWI